MRIDARIDARIDDNDGIKRILKHGGPLIA
jgi:hypothetical protein